MTSQLGKFCPDRRGMFIVNPQELHYRLRSNNRYQHIFFQTLSRFNLSDSNYEGRLANVESNFKKLQKTLQDSLNEVREDHQVRETVLIIITISVFTHQLVN